MDIDFVFPSFIVFVRYFDSGFKRNNPVRSKLAFTNLGNILSGNVHLAPTARSSKQGGICCRKTACPCGFCSCKSKSSFSAKKICSKITSAPFMRCKRTHSLLYNKYRPVLKSGREVGMYETLRRLLFLSNSNLNSKTAASA